MTAAWCKPGVVVKGVWCKPWVGVEEKFLWNKQVMRYATNRWKNDAKRRKNTGDTRAETQETQATKGGAAYDKDKEHDDEDDAATKTTTKATVK